jgi:hypothetical protein
MHWRHNISPNLKFFRVYKMVGKFPALFFGIKTASSSLIIFQRTKLSTRRIIKICWCNWRIFWKINAAGISPCTCCSCTINRRLTGYIQHRTNRSTMAPNNLITHPIHRIRPRRSNTGSLDWKSNWKVAISIPTQRTLLPRRRDWTGYILNLLSW